jgi:hypothetical protein
MQMKGGRRQRCDLEFVDSSLAIRSVRYIEVERAEDGITYTVLNLAYARSFAGGVIAWQDTEGPEENRRSRIAYENGRRVSRDGRGQIYDVH